MNRLVLLSTIIFVHSHLYSQNDYRPGNFIIEPAPERAWIKGAKKITTYKVINSDSLLIKSTFSFTKDGLMLNCSMYDYEYGHNSIDWDFTYNDDKIVKQLKIGGDGFEHHYDEKSRVIKTKRWNFMGDTTITCCYHYSGKNVSYLIDPSGDTIEHYSYNENNQLLSVYYKKQEIRRYEYDQYGNLIKEFNSLENYLEKTHQYDSLNRLIETKAFVDRKYLLGIHSYKYDKEGRTIEYTELDHKKKVFKILLYQYLDESSILEIYYKKRKRKKRKPDEIYAIKYEFW